MDINNIQSNVEKSYQQMQNRWMNFHLRLLPICTAVIAIIEMMMFFVIKETNSLLHTYLDYWLLYVLLPVFLCTLISLTGYQLVKRTNISVKKKQYIISYLFMLFAFIIAWFHSGFVTSLVTIIFPILFTIVYEDHQLTSSLTILGLLILLFSGFGYTFDIDKVIDAYYIINFVICVLLVSITWLTSYYMIRFMKLKKEVIINNDIQRYTLANQIMTDNLTGVGSRSGLMDFIEHADEKCEYCLIMMDIDNFKMFNDQKGHLYGDHILKGIGTLLNQKIPEAAVYRYGGDEFVLIFVDLDIALINQRIDNLFAVVKEQYDISLSAGAVIAKSMAMHKMIYYADEALYQAKKVVGSKLIFKKI